MNDTNYNPSLFYRKFKINILTIIIGYMLVTSILLQTKMTGCQNFPPADVAVDSRNYTFQERGRISELISDSSSKK